MENGKDTSRPPKSQQDCNNWKSKGRCKRNEKGLCPYRHDDSIKQVAIERKRQKMILDTQRRQQTNNNNSTSSSSKEQEQNEIPGSHLRPFNEDLCQNLHRLFKYVVD